MHPKKWEVAPTTGRLETNGESVGSGFKPAGLFLAVDQMQDGERRGGQDPNNTQPDRDTPYDPHSVEPLTPVGKTHVLNEDGATSRADAIVPTGCDGVERRPEVGRLSALLQVRADFVQPALPRDSCTDRASDSNTCEHATSDQTIALPFRDGSMDPPDKLTA